MTERMEVHRFMTPIPHAVDVGQSVRDALHRMRTLRIGHLPVIEADKLVGILSERELEVLEDAHGFRADAVPVSDVMRSTLCSVPPEAPLGEAVRNMAEHHSDCCTVLDHGRVVGILTTTDAMRILSELLTAEPPPQFSPNLRPSEVRTRILDEHQVLRTLFDDIDQLAMQLGDDDDAAVEAILRERCRDLQFALLRHIELENALLVPALREIDAFGPARADQVLHEHASQTRVIVDIIARLDDISSTELGLSIGGLIDGLRADMSHEERALLNPELLRDDVVLVTCTG